MKKNQVKFTLMLLALVLAAFSLFGCGGGSSSTPAAATAPGAPTIGTATGGNAQATVAFTAPASNGGSAITGYTVTSSPGGKTATGAASPLTITGLTNGTSYTFTVTAANSVGSSAASAASNAVTPVAPFAPLTVVQNQTATLNSFVVSGDPNDPAGLALPSNNNQGAYSFGSIPPAYWWGGVGTDSVYAGYGVDKTGTGAGIGVYVKAAGATTWSINGASSVVVGLGANPECVGVCKATLVLVSSPVAACRAIAKNGMTIQAQGVNTGLGINTGTVATATTTTTYTKALTDANWTVEGCTTNTMASFLTLPLKEVHAQILQADMQFTAGAGPLYANGINFGGILFR